MQNDRCWLHWQRAYYYETSLPIPAAAGPQGNSNTSDLAIIPAFTISPRTKFWHVLKKSPTGLEVLAEGSQDSIQGLTVSDTLRVEATGSDLTFYINGQAVAQVSDSDYASGDVGFIVETFDESLAHIHYGSLTIQAVE